RGELDPWGFQLEDGDVFAGLDTHNLRWKLALVVETDSQGLRAAYDVIVGDHVTVAIPDEARTAPRRHLGCRAEQGVDDQFALGHEYRRRRDDAKDVDGVAFVFCAGVG